jgi:hypothetical protein
VSAPKTKPTAASAARHIAAVTNEEQRIDAQTLVALMRRVTKQEPTMWGPSIVGFGSYHYKYASGHEGDSALAGFAVRGSDLVVYIAPAFEGRDALVTARRSRCRMLSHGVLDPHVEQGAGGRGAGASRRRNTRLAERLYLFENLDGSGFRAELPVDEDGIALDYPDLFRRV